MKHQSLACSIFIFFIHFEGFFYVYYKYEILSNLRKEGKLKSIYISDEFKTLKLPLKHLGSD